MRGFVEHGPWNILGFRSPRYLSGELFLDQQKVIDVLWFQSDTAHMFCHLFIFMLNGSFVIAAVEILSLRQHLISCILWQYFVISLGFLDLINENAYTKSRRLFPKTFRRLCGIAFVSESRNDGVSLCYVYDYAAEMKDSLCGITVSSIERDLCHILYYSTLDEWAALKKKISIKLILTICHTSNSKYV